MAAKTALLLDLDGTLLDTAPNLAKALNETLKDAGQQALPLNNIRPHVSNGAAALVRFGFSLNDNDPDFETHRQRLIEHYLADLYSETELFPGMEELLHTLDNRAMRWGVVTNKPARFTDPLLQALGLYNRAGAVISGDTLSARKPDPAPLLHACEQMNVAPEQCIYVGDARRDVEAGQRAGMISLVALFGYIGEDDDVQDWGADGYIDHAEQIGEWMDLT